jgi:2-polyprenyl-3-methyl-5-hydroxy-6-metoxy-1,4-benzoquinol methylase
MFLVSSLLDRYFRARFKNKQARMHYYEKALRKELRSSKLGQIALRNLNELMALNLSWHEEFRLLLKGQDYQAAFWESDLGFLWYQGNLNANNSYFNLAIEHIKAKHFHSALDVGCGWGEFVARISALPEMEAVGIDISEEIIQKAQKLHPKVHFEHKDIMETSGNFDIITFFGSTDYIHPTEFPDILKKALSLANKEILLVNSLRKISFELYLQLKESVEVKRYDTGYVHPISFLLENLKGEYDFTYTIQKAGSDSALVTILKE